MRLLNLRPLGIMKWGNGGKPGGGNKEILRINRNTLIRNEILVHVFDNLIITDILR